MSDDALRDLIEQHHQLDELTKHPGWEVLTDYALHGPAGSLHRQQSLVNGGARDWDAYKFEVGWLAGAHHVLNARDTVAAMVASARERTRDAQEAEAQDREEQ